MENTIFPKWMLQLFGLLLNILMIVLILSQLKNMDQNSQTLKVSALGKITATPDVATVTLGVTSQGANPIEVKDKNNQKINQVIAFIKQQNIDTKDIKTTQFYAYPRYNYTNGQNTIVGYQSDQMVTITVRQIDKSRASLEKMVDGAVNNGANNIQGIYFSFSDDTKLRQEARVQAIANAKEKAEELANATDLKLGKIMNVLESGSEYPQPLNAAPATMNFERKSTTPTIEPGSQDITESMTVVFKIN